MRVRGAGGPGGGGGTDMKQYQTPSNPIGLQPKEGETPQNEAQLSLSYLKVFWFGCVILLPNGHQASKS